MIQAMTGGNEAARAYDMLPYMQHAQNASLSPDGHDSSLER